MSVSANPSASLWRRLAAMVYDSLLMFAVLIVIGATTLPLTNGLGISRDNIFLRLYVFGALFLFLGWFWTHGGQTLGMRAWKIRLLQKSGDVVSWQQAFFYYLVSLPGWGLVFIATFYTVLANHSPMLRQYFPAWLVYSLALVWFIIDHLPDNWREKVSGLRMIQVG
jgi:uncharacterized RDD family membrane protein YckC